MCVWGGGVAYVALYHWVGSSRVYLGGGGGGVVFPAYSVIVARPSQAAENQPKHSKTASQVTL